MSSLAVWLRISDRCRRTRLAQRVGARERLVLHAEIRDPAYGRKRGKIIFEEVCTGCLADKADVGNGDGIALAIAPGLLAAGEVGFERLQGFPDPMTDPFEPRGLVKLELVFEILTHPRHQQRMRVAGDDLRERSHAGARPWRRGQKRRLWVRLVEIFEDCERL